MDIRTTITEFKQHLKAGNYAEKTIEGYRKGLDWFAAFLSEQGIEDLRKVSREVMAAYQEKVQAQPIAMESKALKIRPIKRLFEYLVERNLLLINPTEGMIETCRKNRKIGTVLTIEETKKLLDQPNLSLKTGIRDRAILEIFYSTGIRLDELINLEIYHADLKDQVLYIRKAKGRKQRVVPLGKSASKILREYLEKIRPFYAKKNPKERRLFINHSGLAMTPEAIRQILRKHRIDAGIKKSVSPHTLRRTCATHLVQQGADIRYVQELLGHSRLSTTHIYTKVMPKEVKEIHDTYHPGKDLPVLSEG
jgi:site-specific recombinase XerD